MRRIARFGKALQAVRMVSIQSRTPG